MQPRIAALQQKHAHIEQRLAHQLTRPLPDGIELMRLKIKKLRIKDEVEAMRRRQSRSGQ